MFKAISEVIKSKVYFTTTGSTGGPNWKCHGLEDVSDQILSLLIAEVQAVENPCDLCEHKAPKLSGQICCNYTEQGVARCVHVKTVNAIIARIKGE